MTGLASRALSDAVIAEDLLPALAREGHWEYEGAEKIKKKLGQAEGLLVAVCGAGGATAWQSLWRVTEGVRGVVKVREEIGGRRGEKRRGRLLCHWPKPAFALPKVAQRCSEEKRLREELDNRPCSYPRRSGKKSSTSGPGRQRNASNGRPRFSRPRFGLRGRRTRSLATARRRQKSSCQPCSSECHRQRCPPLSPHFLSRNVCAAEPFSPSCHGVFLDVGLEPDLP